MLKRPENGITTNDKNEVFVRKLYSNKTQRHGN